MAAMLLLGFGWMPLWAMFIGSLFSKKEYNQLMDYFEDMMQNRVKPDFGDDPHRYFQKLIEDEKQRLSIQLGK